MREKARKVQGLGRKGIAKNYPKWLKADLGKSLGRFNPACCRQGSKFNGDQYAPWGRRMRTIVFAILFKFVHLNRIGFRRTSYDSILARSLTWYSKIAGCDKSVQRMACTAMCAIII